MWKRFGTIGLACLVLAGASMASAASAASDPGYMTLKYTSEAAPAPLEAKAVLASPGLPMAMAECDMAKGPMKKTAPGKKPPKKCIGASVPLDDGYAASSGGQWPRQRGTHGSGNGGSGHSSASVTPDTGYVLAKFKKGSHPPKAPKAKKTT